VVLVGQANVVWEADLAGALVVGDKIEWLFLFETF
jgi:hypothetical protein